MEQQQKQAEGGAVQSNGTAAQMPEQQQQKRQAVGCNVSSSKEQKKKRKARKDEHMTDERIDHFIHLREQIVAKGNEIEDEDFDLNDEANLEACVKSLKMRDQCLVNAVQLEQRLLPHVIFDDVEDEAQKDDLIDVIQRVERVVITNSGLEPLNVKLTEFINNPLNYNDNGPALHPRAITSINHNTPSFNQIKQMIEQVRAKGDCPLVDSLAPADNPTVYDAFVCKVLADLLDILKRQRFYTNLRLIEREAQSREQQRQQHNAATSASSSAVQNGVAGTVAVFGTEEQDSMLMAAGPSSSFVEQYDNINASSTHEKFLDAIQKGEIQPEGEDTVQDGEDLDGVEDESHSEAGSEDYTESMNSSTTETVTACNAELQQQQQIAKTMDDVEEDEHHMKIDNDGRFSAAIETPILASPQQSDNTDSKNDKDSTATPVPTSSRAVTVAFSSSEKVRLQQHQLDKLFSSAACLRSSPPLAPPSPSSMIKSEIIDLTLEDDSDDESCPAGDEDDDDDLEIIGEVNENEEDNIDDGGGEHGGTAVFETLSSSASPISSEVCVVATSATTTMTMNESGRRKRKSEDEEGGEMTAANRMGGKRRRRTEAEDDDDDDIVTVEDEANSGQNEEEEDSTDVVQDSEDEKDTVNGRKRACLDDNDEEENKPNTCSKGDDQQQLMELVDDDSIICLSDG